MHIENTMKTAVLSLFAFLAGLSPWSPVSARAADDGEIRALKAQVRDLQERLGRLERDRAAAPSGAAKAYWKNGFRIEYTDPASGSSYKFRFRTGIQLRYTYAVPDDALADDVTDNDENYSSFVMRRLRFFVDGTAPSPDWRYFVHVQLEPQSAVNVHDAFVQWQKFRALRVQFGRMKIPFGMEYWQSGFRQNGTDRTIFTGDSEMDKDLFGNRLYDFPGDNARLRVSKHRDSCGFPTGGMLLYRSQGVVLNGDLDLLGRKDFIDYRVGVFNGRDTRAWSSQDADMLYVARIGINFLPGSDPKGPLGPSGFNNYFSQGDYGYNTRPLAALVIGGFHSTDRVKAYHQLDAATTNPKTWHDTRNYGFDTALLFRFRGLSLDLEAGWEEFVQDPGKGTTASSDQETWDRLAARINLGYFVIPKRLELVAKAAYFERIRDNDAAASLKSGLGLVTFEDGGEAVEDNLQQYVLGVNYYLHGFNQYVTADVAWGRREFTQVTAAEAAAFGVTPELSPGDQDDYRFRVMYQFLF
ncbi:hypothetical protein G3N55_07420 [Dissulfurirhabdus thermomarina]|uniref:Porin n=1 Tax=Dissulfurirhabdus thermomarina TaxID=1765737 RepID=A0A6N9TNE8_DISTH|nr:porin [Dissulfurirhabdus thermomarina]NDY42669.1 hypothetical protein [Dissulfurirhabdus thermomarina]NMX23723.1 hypothetical protein [Dissulfurirhabdus thermomarina]